MLRRRLLTFSFAVLGLSSLALAQDDKDLLAVRDARFQSVVALGLQIDGEFEDTFCSGTLVAPRLVLTATHCLDYFDDEDGESLLFPALKAEQLIVITGPGGRRQRLVVDRITYPAMPLRKEFQKDGSWRGTTPEMAPSNDFALLHLQEDARHISPMELLPEDVTLDELSTLRLSVTGYPSRSTAVDQDGLPVAVSNLKGCAIYEYLNGGRDLATDCVASPGNSGGPILAEWQGRVFLVANVVSGDDLEGTYSKAENLRGENRITTLALNVLHPHFRHWLNEEIKASQRSR